MFLKIIVVITVLVEIQCPEEASYPAKRVNQHSMVSGEPTVPTIYQSIGVK